MGLAFHPLSGIFPLMEGAEFESLCRSLRENGLRERIWLYEEQILDGRNRYRACLEVGVEPCFRAYDGDDALKFVVDLNLERRHLNESQRAMVAARVATLSGPGRPAEIVGIPTISQSEAARMLNVSRDTVNAAAKVRAQGAGELVAAVEKGQVAVSAALPLLEMPRQEQKQVIAALLQSAGGGKISGTRIEKAVKVLAGETTNVHVSDDSYEWYTPGEYIQRARAVMREIDLDPASTEAANRVVQAARFYTKEDDALARPWAGRVWLNPPYSAALVAAFTRRLIEAYDAGAVTEAMLLVNNCTDAAWFQPLLSRFPACFPAGRLKFWTPERPDLAARQGQALFYLGQRMQRFRDVFTGCGALVVPL